MWDLVRDIRGLKWRIFLLYWWAGFGEERPWVLRPRERLMRKDSARSSRWWPRRRVGMWRLRIVWWKKFRRRARRVASDGLRRGSGGEASSRLRLRNAVICWTRDCSRSFSPGRVLWLKWRTVRLFWGKRRWMARRRKMESGPPEQAMARGPW